MVLLILAGITITTLTGNNGIIEMANRAKTVAQNAKKEEEIILLKQELAFISESKIQTLDYNESTKSIANPDRGWYSYWAMSITDEEDNINTSIENKLKEQENLGESLISFFVNLEDTSGAINGSADREITANELAKIDNALSIVRKYNQKVILRFRYIISSQNRYKEPSMDMILKHIEQLGAIMQKNKDVINVVEAGFLGSSGEWVPTNYSDTESRQKIVFKLLEVLPKEIMVNVRTPRYYREIFNTQNPIDNTTKFSGEYASRVGLHNDGYLGSITDLGTYGAKDREKELVWQNSHNQYTIFGGEASTDTSDASAAQYSDAVNAIKDMFTTHCTYLNRNHYDVVLNKWKETKYDGDNREYRGKTNYEYIGDHLGYRYVLRESKLDTSKGILQGVLKIENTGFANMVHEKQLEVIIEQNGNYYKAMSDIDVREWRSKETITIPLLYSIPKDIKTGEWKVYIKISDKLNTDYCVQFANNNIWRDSLKANYVGKIDIQTNDIGNESYFAQIDSNQQVESNGLQKIEDEEEGKVIYFDKSGSWASASKIYAVLENNKGEWYSSPGILGTLVRGTDNVYKFVLPKEYENGRIGFNNGVFSGTGKMEIEMIDIPEESGYIYKENENSRAVYFVYGWEEKEESEDGTDKGQQVNIYMWNSETGEKLAEWPGVKAESLYKTGDYYAYKYNLPEEYDSFIFTLVNMNTGVARSKTRDFKFVGGNRVYRNNGGNNDPTETSVYSEGRWEIYNN